MASVYDCYAASTCLTSKQHICNPNQLTQHVRVKVMISLSMSHQLPGGPIEDMQRHTRHYLLTISSLLNRILAFSKPQGVWQTCADACCQYFHLYRPEVSPSKCGSELSHQTTRSGSKSSSVDVLWKGHRWSVYRNPHVQSPGCR